MPVSTVLCWGRAVVLLVSTSPRCRASVKSWGCAHVVDGSFMRLLSRPLGVVRIRWRICRRGWCGYGAGGWRQHRWVAAGVGEGGCGAGGRWRGQVVLAARLEGGARPAGWKWLRCRWAVAGPGRASRSSTPSGARVWRSRGRAAAHRHTEQPQTRRVVLAPHGGLAAGGRTEVWRRDVAGS